MSVGAPTAAASASAPRCSRRPLAWAADAGYSKVVLSAFPHNTRAIAFYERHGFTLEGCRARQFRRDGRYLDELLMGRSIGAADVERPVAVPVANALAAPATPVADTFAALALTRSDVNRLGRALVPVGWVLLLPVPFLVFWGLGWIHISRAHGALVEHGVLHDTTAPGVWAALAVVYLVWIVALMVASIWAARPARLPLPALRPAHAADAQGAPPPACRPQVPGGPRRGQPRRAARDRPRVARRARDARARRREPRRGRSPRARDRAATPTAAKVLRTTPPTGRQRKAVVLARIAKASIERVVGRRRHARGGRPVHPAQEGRRQLHGALPVPRRKDAVVLGRPGREALLLLRLRRGRRPARRSSKRRRTSTSPRRSRRWPTASACSSTTRRRAAAPTPTASAASACSSCSSSPAPTTSACCGRRGRRQAARAYLSRARPRRGGLPRSTAWASALPGWANLRDAAAKKGFSERELTDAGLVVPGKKGGVYDRFRGRLMFPLADERGRVLGFGARTLGDDKPKYLNSPETLLYHKSEALFGLDQAKASAARLDRLFVVEGYTDVIALVQAGVTNVVASMGTAFTEEQLKRLTRHTRNLFLCFDADAAGLGAMNRALELARRQRRYHARGARARRSRPRRLRARRRRRRGISGACGRRRRRCYNSRSAPCLLLTTCQSVDGRMRAFARLAGHPRAGGRAPDRA